MLSIRCRVAVNSFPSCWQFCQIAVTSLTSCCQFAAKSLSSCCQFDVKLLSMLRQVAANSMPNCFQFAVKLQIRCQVAATSLPSCLQFAATRLSIRCQIAVKLLSSGPQPPRSPSPARTNVASLYQGNTSLKQSSWRTTRHCVSVGPSKHRAVFGKCLAQSF